MLTRNHHPSKRTSQQVTAGVRLMEAKEGFDRMDVSWSTVQFAIRQCLSAGMKVATLVELTGYSERQIKDARNGANPR